MRTLQSLNPIFALVLACAATGTLACAQVDADVPDAEVTQKAVSFLGIPGGAAMGEVSTTQTFTLSSDKLSWAKNLNSEVYAESVTITALGDLPNLDFIHYARVTMSSGAGVGATIPPVELINYQRPDGVSSSPYLTVDALYPVDVTKVWAAGKVVITMQLVGIFPEKAWSADVTLHLTGKMSYKL
jgi:hypothetical protein